ncbi:MAG: VWA domain-containing protein [Candidatus Tectomicrobia bacterium]|nr:VWA domain-containing protein [Candidatus Tectomicrobia bacterium]
MLQAGGLVGLLEPAYLALLALLAWGVWWGLRGEGARRAAPAPWRRRLATALRGALFLALILALAGLALPSTTLRATLFLLLDWSDSMGERGREAALTYARNLAAATAPSTSSGLLLFAAQSSLELEPQPRPTLPAPASQLDTHGTNIEQALQRAVASFPATGSRHLVLISDGNENQGQADAMRPLLRSLGIKLWSVPLTPAARDNDVFVSDIILPERLREGEPFAVKVLVVSQRAATGELLLLRDDLLAAQESVALHAGQNAFTFELSETAKGLHRFEASITVSDDPIVENNRLRRFVETSGAPRLLYVQEPDAAPAPLEHLLNAQGYATVRTHPATLPDSLSAYLGYDAIIFDNVSGFTISLAKMELIERYVRDTGGGFIMLGGERSFSAGGYYRTPIEDLLPVSMDVKSELTLPSIAMVLVIDKSGSMTSTIFGETKLDVAKVASFGAVELLNPADRVGVLAFDAKPQWIIPLTTARGRASIAEALGRLDAGGGTDLYQAMEEAFQVLEKEEAVIRHLLVLSDGLTDARDFEGLARRIKAARITVSTVAMGDDADVRLMHNLAAWTDGRSYFTNDPLTIPRIFTNETLLAARQLIIERRLPIRPESSHEVLAELPLGTLPAIDGYVLSFAKPTATHLLRVGENDPLLAIWQYGLGRSAAFTSDLRGRWSSELLRWPRLSQLAGQLLRWVQRPPSAGHLEASIATGREEAVLEVAAYDGSGRFLNDLRLTAVRSRVGSEPQELHLEQAAPGTYRASFPTPAEGEEIFTIQGVTAEVAEETAPPAGSDRAASRERQGSAAAVVGPRSIGYAVPYTREYLSGTANLALLRRLAEETGGALLDPGGDARAQAARLEGGGGWTATYQRLWRLLSLIALGLLLLDIAVRRVSLPERLASGWRRRGDQAAAAAHAPAEAPLDYDTLSQMIRARTRPAEEGERAPQPHGGGTAAAPRPWQVYMAGLRDRKERGQD